MFGGAKPVPIDTRNLKWKEWGMALVAIAGPATNILLAFIAFVIGHFTGWLYGTGGTLTQFFFEECVFVNLGFAIFNILPIPPLDGSRVLYAIAPDGFRAVLQNLEQFGIIMVYLLILVFGEAFSHLMVNGVNGLLDLFYLIVGGS